MSTAPALSPPTACARSAPPDVESLRRQVAQVRWWHTMDLGHGVRTPGLDDTPAKLPRLRLPADLRGQTVLDVGAWDGFYSFEAERRGAGRVLATDSFCWGGGGWGSKAGFELARRSLGSRVEDRTLDVLDLDAATTGTFDLVLFLGVLYHMRHPLLALEKVFAVTHHQLILETHVDLCRLPCPALAFYPQAEFGADDTNWWGPNPAAVLAMLKAVGFRTVRVVYQGPDPDPGRRTLRQAVRSLNPFRRRPQRLVVHAFR
jgi:tRNA (mo5U34)-methyltransferase